MDTATATFTKDPLSNSGKTVYYSSESNTDLNTKELNMNGNKKISDIFVNEKIPMKKRKSWPIVTDADNNIVWLPGLKKSKFDKQKNEKYDIILKYH